MSILSQFQKKRRKDDFHLVIKTGFIYENGEAKVTLLTRNRTWAWQVETAQGKLLFMLYKTYSSHELVVFQLQVSTVSNHALGFCSTAFCEPPIASVS